MPFGWQNETAAFPTEINVILPTFRPQYDLVHLEVVAVFPKTVENHIECTGYVLRLLKDVGVMLELKKRAFFTILIDYLSYLIRSRKLEVASPTAEAIQKITSNNHDD